MHLLTPPSSARIQAFLAQQSCLPFSYSQVGATHLQVCQVPGYLPKGYVIDHNRILLGHGEAVFIKARAALLAFSRPNQTLVRFGYPLARSLQRRFAADSLAAMRQAVLQSDSPL